MISLARGVGPIHPGIIDLVCQFRLHIHERHVVTDICAPLWEIHTLHDFWSPSPPYPEFRFVSKIHGQFQVESETLREE